MGRERARSVSPGTHTVEDEFLSLSVSEGERQEEGEREREAWTAAEERRRTCSGLRRSMR